MVLIFLEIYAALYIGMIVFSLLSFLFLGKSKPSKPNMEEPFVSVLVAARNEEKYISSCIQSLKLIDYPKDKIEFLIGNDASEDDTRNIALKAIDIDSRFLLIDIHENLGQSKGKANVLANLARQAKGKYLFITDADILVNPLWIKSLLLELDPSTHIVSGSTIVNDGSFQDLDWRFFTMILQGTANIGIGGTAVGNNMAIDKDVYFKVGGYENIPFSIVEDYALFKAVTEAGYGWKNIYDRTSLNITWPINDFMTLLNQRKRWATGALTFPWYWILFFGMFGASYIVIVWMLILNPLVAAAFVVSKYTIQAISQLIIARRLKIQLRIYNLLFYEGYNFFFNIILSIWMFFPKVVWKNRKF